VITATIVKPGLLRSCRRAYRTSWNSAFISSCSLYSYRNATMGLTFDARFAGR
jgi:hypothetical protein